MRESRAESRWRAQTECRARKHDRTGDRSSMNWQTARAGNYLSHKQVMTAVFLLATALGAYLVSGYVVSNDLVGLVMLALPFAFFGCRTSDGSSPSEF
jgi:hypothetical protein